ncbi:MAG: cobalamin biosynthesis protein [Proteobacteria bacterium]|nr:cobalamin biosynthesis protein [Pseudomonadota bacterium]
MPEMLDKKIIITYITKSGEKLAKIIKDRVFKNATLKKLGSGQHEVFFEEAFRNYDAVIAIMAVGIVVRGISKYLKDKTTDPAVIVIDEKGKFVISLLSGHLGGANEITEFISKRIKALPVITTSSDLNNYPAIDVYAKRSGYIISDKNLYKKLVMEMLDGKKIPVYLEDDEDDSFFQNNPFKILKDINEFKKRRSPKIYVGVRKTDSQTLHLISKKLVLGMGFHRGIDEKSLFEFTSGVFTAHSLWLSAVSKIATIDKRKGEAGFERFAKKLKAEVFYFSEGELKEVKLFEESKKVLKYHNVGNISETCAYLAGNGGKILVPKIRGGNITICVSKERYL